MKRTDKEGKKLVERENESGGKIKQNEHKKEEDKEREERKERERMSEGERRRLGGLISF